MNVALLQTRILRVVVGLLAWGWSFYCFGSIAAASRGRLDIALAIGGALALPAALLPWLGLPRGRTLGLTVLLLLSALCLALAWLHLEAQQLLGEALRDREVAYVQRAWPFGNSAVAYSPERGIWWDD